MKIKNNLTLNIALLVTIFTFHTSAFSEDTKSVVTVTAKTKAYGGEYTPANCTMMWIQTPAPEKKFIKTIYKGAQQYVASCAKWVSISGGKLQSFDGLTGATRPNHETTLKATWDCTGRDSNGKSSTVPVPNGKYEFWIEMNEDDIKNAPAKSSFGTIEIDGTSKKVQGTTTEFIPVLEAEYCVGPCTNASVNNLKCTATNNLHVINNGKQLSIELPNSDAYSVSLISPNGRIIQKVNGTGKKAQLSTTSYQMKRGVYFITVAQAGKSYTVEHLFGF